MVVTICALNACSLAHPRKASIAPGVALLPLLPPVAPAAAEEEDDPAAKAEAEAEAEAAPCEWRCFIPSARATAAEGGGSDAGWSRSRDDDDKEAAVVGRDACDAR